MCRYALSRYTLSRYALSRYTLSRYTLSRYTLSRYTLSRYEAATSPPSEAYTQHAQPLQRGLLEALEALPSVCGIDSGIDSPLRQRLRERLRELRVRQRRHGNWGLRNG